MGFLYYENSNKGNFEQMNFHTADRFPVIRVYFVPFDC